MTMKRILFVDDEASILKILGVVMKRHAGEWECHFAGGGPEALEMAGRIRFDVVVSDMRMVPMTGLELLASLMRSQPSTVRVIMSGHTDDGSVQESIGIIHQWMAKPFSLKSLNETLDKIARAQARLSNPAVKDVVGRMHKLPSAPDIYFRIIAAQQDPNCSIHSIASIVAHDPGLTATILKLINSAFFGPSRDISDPAEAIQYLGISRIRSLTLVHHLSAHCDAIPEISIEDFQRSAMRTAQCAHLIAAQQGRDRRVQEESFTAGLLLDVGRLVLAGSLPQEYREIRALARRKSIPWHLAEREILGATHADIGAYLLGTWGLPISLVEAVAFHEDPSVTGVHALFSPLTAVHLAGVWAHEGTAAAHDVPPASLDMPYLTALGLQGERDRMRAALGTG